MSAPEQPDRLAAAKAKLAACQDDSCIIRGEVRKDFVQVDAPWLIAEVERLRAALNEVATHPAQDVNPGQAYEGDWMMAYRDGVRDGHRAAANIARAALEQAP